jgi:hypothetical protein
VDISTSRGFTAGSPRPLFRTGLRDWFYGVETYGVTADGQRFLFQMPAVDNRPPELKVVLDWPALLAKPGSPMEAP